LRTPKKKEKHIMAKKIRLDFSKTEERSGWNTRHMPEGLHKMKVTGVQQTQAGDGTDMLVYSLQPADAKYKSRNFPFYCKLQDNQLWKLRDLRVAAGVSVPKKAGMIDPAGPVGKLIAVEVEDDEYKGSVRSQAQGTYSLDILDGDGPSNDEDDVDEEEEGDDEEYDADDEEDDEGDDDEDEEDEEEDLDSLSLPELRKRAKELGIKTTGLKKDELIEAILEEEDAEDDEEDEDEDDLDEDDLDDEELEDEEFEDDEDDEEEEPEPAPRRRAAAKKPAAKAPAKTAPKASARRTVKRR